MTHKQPTSVEKNVVEYMTDEHLLAWRDDVQKEIEEQCRLRAQRSAYFRPDLLSDQTTRETEINEELAKRGHRSVFTNFTDPAVFRKQTSLYQ